MKALILAAGFSLRLYPLTTNFPKGLLKIKDRPLITNILNKVVDNPRVNDLALITNQIGWPHFKKFLSENNKYSKIKLLNNGIHKPEKRLGAIGDFIFALNELSWDSDILLLPSDTLVSLDFTELFDFYKTRRSFVNVVYNAHDKEIIRNKLGCAQLNGDKLVGFQEKPPEPKSTFQSVPIYIYPQKNLELVRCYARDKANNLDSPGAIIPFLIEKTDAYAFKIQNGFYYDVGTKEILEKLNTQV